MTICFFCHCTVQIYKYFIVLKDIKELKLIPLEDLIYKYFIVLKDNVNVEVDKFREVIYKYFIVLKAELS